MRLAIAINIKNASWGLICLLTMAVEPSLCATTIQWGSGYNDYLYDSNGTALDGNYMMQAGVFLTSFTPTSSNLSLWEANWRVFDGVSEGQGWSSADQEFLGTASLLAGGFSDSSASTPGYSFVAGQQVYFWIYNSKSLTNGTEWALLTDNSTVGNLGNEWTMPPPATGNTYQWLLLDADTPVYGGVNNIIGGGTPASVVPAAYSLQTYSVVAVPEPSAALLIGAAGMLWIGRRHQHPRIV